MLTLDILIFDMDGVLVDASESYRDAIRATVRIYIQEVVGLDPGTGDLASRSDVDAFKLAGGLNNDWDLTTAIVKYYLDRFEISSGSTPRPTSTKDIVAFLRAAGARAHRMPISRPDAGLVPYAGALRGAGGGLAAVARVLGGRNDWLLFAEGGPLGTNLVKRIFEEVYLGEELFRAEYGEPPLVHRGEGLIRRERLIASKDALETLSRRAALGIATGRPGRQASYALDRAGIGAYFRERVTHEDVVAAERMQSEAAGKPVRLGKPHPYMLLAAADRIGPAGARCAYVGDTLDDVRAANAAKAERSFVSIGCLAPAPDKAFMRREFEQAGADLIVDHPDDLVDWIKKPSA